MLGLKKKLCSGLLGVLFSIPLRASLLNDPELRFPEGVATAEVLKIGDRTADGGGLQASAAALFRAMLQGFGFGGVYKAMSAGLHLWGEFLSFGSYVGVTVLKFEVGLSPALLGVGYIVGLSASAQIIFGAIIGQWLIIPLASIEEDVSTICV